MSDQLLNHLAVSVPHEALNEVGRKALLDFYGEVFGWTEIKELRLDDRLTLRISASQYLNVRSRDDPMRCSGYEHFGVSVTSQAMFQGIRDRARSYAQRDPAVEFVETETTPLGRSTLRVFRVRYRIPLTVEVQFLDSGR